MSLVKQGEVWHYRKAVPEDLRTAFGAREFKRTLRTGSKRAAEKDAAAWDARMAKVVTLLRSGCLPPGSDTRLITALRASNLSTPDHDLLQLAISPPASPASTADDLPRLSSLIEAFTQEKILRGEWTEKTKREMSAILAAAVDGLGDPPAALITRAALVEWLAREGEILALQTVRKRATCLASLYKWATRHEHVPRNVAEGLTPRAPTTRNRRAYTPDELAKIVGALRPYHARGHVDRWMIPLIAAHSGMRLEEVCGLRCAELRQIGGMWCFDLTRRPQLKTPAARRLVPVHSVLLKAGLVDYVDTVREAGREDVWGLTWGVAGYSQYWGRWYQHLSWRTLPKGAGVVFHSFRHGFVGSLKDVGVMEAMIAELVGHKHAGISFGVYADPYRVAAKAAAVEAFRLPESVNVSGLVWSGGI